MNRSSGEFENYLAEAGILSRDQIASVHKEAGQSKLSFKKATLKLNLLTEDAYANAEAGFLEMPFAHLEDYTVDESALKLVPANVARAHGVLPVFRVGDTLTIAVHDPHNLLAIDQIREITRLNIEVILATESDIHKAIKQYYGIIGQGLVEGVRPPREEAKTAAGLRSPLTGTFDMQETKIVKLVNETILQAIEDGASDIHIEPEDDFVRIRNRVDGVLTEVAQLPKDLQNPMISRLKILAKLDIAENRKPQDGRIQMKLEDRNVDIRVSSFPTSNGENVVMRILEQASIELELGKLGFDKALEKRFHSLLQKPYGIILVTGPTGAGKTTTLYAALKSINTVDKNVMTVEDPIEYRMKMIRQTQVNLKAGLTFATGLRSILRQDPDVILVGEIRDRETAEIAIQAALTGHLVFSTLHTNDAPGAITRLIDMGIEPFLISSSLIGVIAQRLVRVICTRCRQKDGVVKAALSEGDIGILKGLNGESVDKLELYRGKGCKHCSQRGYRGRSGIYELMLVDEPIRNLIVSRASSADIRKHWLGHDQPMKWDGFRKVLQGITTIEEVLRVTQE